MAEPKEPPVERRYRGGQIFDGTRLHRDAVLDLGGGRVIALGPDTARGAGPGQPVTEDLAGDILCPGYVDLQVNGGGGVMLGDVTGPDDLRRMARAHRGLGATTILPTLITDSPDRTAAAIAHVRAAIASGLPGIGGLHLEGPHLSLARKGAHDAALIRPMQADDLAMLCAAARDLPALVVILAPESTTPDQVAALARAGARVCLGHTDADYDTCLAFARAGAVGVTHLFNAMSQLGSRAPGLVGAALDCGGLTAGLIADGVHVHPATIRRALAAKAGPGTVFLVSDAMAVAGTDLDGFSLGGRRIDRGDGRLVLQDGTLAGADLDLTTAVTLLTGSCGVEMATALAMATRIPADFAGLADVGRIAPGTTGPLLRLRPGARGLALVDIIDP